MKQSRTIVFYTPVNFRCRDIESLARKFADEGHRVMLISQCPEGALHQSFKNLGLEAEALPEIPSNAWMKTFRRAQHLIKFLREHRVDLLFSHLEPTNFISVMIQPFTSAKVIIFRHHVDIAALFGFDKTLTYRLTYRLARRIIAVSKAAKQYMIEHESVRADKITHIDLGYDFSLYGRADENAVDELKAKYPADLLLVTAGSLTNFKRPEVSIELTRLLRDSNINVKLLLLGEGPALAELEQQVDAYHLQQHVVFAGYTNQIMNYLYAADWLIHPSISEASSVIVKEAALANLPVMVCREVGDFDEYLNSSNAVILDQDKFAEQAKEHLIRYMADKTHYTQLSERLKQDVLQRFSIESTFKKYESVISEK